MKNEYPQEPDRHEENERALEKPTAALGLGAYLLHMRPKSWPVVFMHCCVGGVLGLAKIEWGVAEVGRIALAAALWAVFLNGGTLALNSAIDDDDGDIGYLNDPPSAPKGLAGWGAALMVLGGMVAWFVSRGYFSIYAICLFLSILYSVPPVRLKTVAGFDVAVNMIGYGALTLLAGYFAVEQVFRQVAVFASVGFAFLFAGLYPMTQIYQLAEDARKGARGFTVRLGPKRALLFANLAVGFAFANFAALYLICRTGWPGLLALVLSAGAWLAVLLPWAARFNTYPHKKGMYRSLWAWALTEGLLAAVWLGKILS